VPFKVPWGNVIGGVVSGALEGDCVIAEGRFEDQPVVNGMPGSPWVLYDNGVLVICGGCINWSKGDDPWMWMPSPWFDYSANIYRIVFTGRIIVGASLDNLFHGLYNE